MYIIITLCQKFKFIDQSQPNILGSSKDLEKLIRLYYYISFVNSIDNYLGKIEYENINVAQRNLLSQKHCEKFCYNPFRNSERQVGCIALTQPLRELKHQKNERFLCLPAWQGRSPDQNANATVIQTNVKHRATQTAYLEIHSYCSMVLLECISLLLFHNPFLFGSGRQSKNRRISNT